MIDSEASDASDAAACASSTWGGAHHGLRPPGRRTARRTGRRNRTDQKPIPSSKSVTWVTS